MLPNKDSGTTPPDTVQPATRAALLRIVSNRPKEDLERILITSQILALFVAPVVVYWLFQRHELNLQVQASQNQIVARVFEVANQPEHLDDEVALLSSLGDAGVPLLLRLLKQNDPLLVGPVEIPLGALNRDSLLGEPPDSLWIERRRSAMKSFMEISYALYGDGTQTLQALQQAIQLHPDPAFQKSCILTLYLLPRLEALPFLESVAKDTTRDAEVRGMAFLALTAGLQKYHQARVLAGFQISGPSFQMAALDGLVLAQSSLSSDLRAAHFRGAQLDHVILSTNDMSDSDWTSLSATSQSTDSRPAVLTNVHFHIRGSLNNADFSRALLTNVVIEGEASSATSQTLSRPDSLVLSYARLSNVVLRDLQLSDVNLGGAHIKDLVVEHSSLSNANFDPLSTLRGIQFVHDSLNGIDFSGATLSDVSFDGDLIQDLGFDSAVLENVRILGGSVTQINAANARGNLTLSCTQVDLQTCSDIRQRLGTTSPDLKIEIIRK